MLEILNAYINEHSTRLKNMKENRAKEIDHMDDCQNDAIDKQIVMQADFTSTLRELKRKYELTNPKKETYNLRELMRIAFIRYWATENLSAEKGLAAIDAVIDASTVHNKDTMKRGIRLLKIESNFLEDINDVLPENGDEDYLTDEVLNAAISKFYGHWEEDFTEAIKSEDIEE